MANSKESLEVDNPLMARSGTGKEISSVYEQKTPHLRGGADYHSPNDRLDYFLRFRKRDFTILRALAFSFSDIVDSAFFSSF